MIIRFDPERSPRNFAAMLESIAALEEVGSVMILSCDDDARAPEDVDDALRACPKPVFGGVFPRIIAEGRDVSRGTLMVGFSSPARVVSVNKISDESTSFEKILERETVSAEGERTICFVFVDGMARRISAFTEALFDAFGPSLNYVGGGAGSLASTTRPCLFTPDGLISDGALVVFTGMPGGVGAGHGWSPVSMPVKVTDAQLNIVRSLDWEPAFSVYRGIVENHSGRSFDSEPFFSIAKAYPLGIGRLDAEFVVRDPLMLAGDGIVCVGEVPEGAFVSVLHGDTDSLLKGAAAAKRKAEESVPEGMKRKAVFFADCISRVLFLEDDFGRELASIGDSLPMFGALTIGEIANNGREYLEFFNKTAVIAILGE